MADPRGTPKRGGGVVTENPGAPAVCGCTSHKWPPGVRLGPGLQIRVGRAGLGTCPRTRLRPQRRGLGDPASARRPSRSAPWSRRTPNRIQLPPWGEGSGFRKAAVVWGYPPPQAPGTGRHTEGEGFPQCPPGRSEMPGQSQARGRTIHLYPPPSGPLQLQLQCTCCNSRFCHQVSARGCSSEQEAGLVLGIPGALSSVLRWCKSTQMGFCCVVSLTGAGAPVSVPPTCVSCRPLAPTPWKIPRMPCGGHSPHTPGPAPVAPWLQPRWRM